MPVGISQPSNQIRLTNVAIVRIKKGKKRFELACYKNKVLEYRSGVETDLDEVLQISQVFTNVSKGAVAPKADLVKAFGASATQDAIVLEILQKGELQVGEKERGAKLESLNTEVIDIVASKCVDPGTKRVYTASMIEKALAECEDWHGVRETKSAKASALEAIKVLVAAQVIPIARARMRLRVTATKKGKDKCMEFIEEIEEEEIRGAGEWECTAFVEPGRYKALVDVVGTETKGRGRVEILDTAVVYEGES
ncbi:SBDS protein C-terminal domain-containing protein [Geopyxis carbonaria]|nr:SBDS protein C-terminal domain-containing protein [Geopyxis carbonaria]